MPELYYYETLGSTLDATHDLASKGAMAGTCVIADEQTAGRGRLGRRWTSRPGAGLWMTMLDRPSSSAALDVLALRVGLYVAEALDGLASTQVQVKWPNDLQIHGRKLAGILVETRWRGASAEWVAIGLGLNIIDPGTSTSIGLGGAATRLDVLRLVVRAIRLAGAPRDYLSPGELSRFAARDALHGKQIVEPAPGIADGVTAEGELRIRNGGDIVMVRSGSVSLARPD